mmetsp:Transcript_34345/g.35639  ORF Transcript_34345/g.35639 Transcript_34345/m.35639 type:complete len:493 (+) Transcript_34345:12-1490(+)
MLRPNFGSNGDSTGRDSKQQGYQLVDVAKSLINQRADKLKYEKEMLGRTGKSKPSNFGPRNDVSSLYNLQNMIKGKNLMNPNLYSYQYVDPIYYPMEMPTNGEPMMMPKVELGQPMFEPQECNQCCGHEGNGLNLADILSLLRPKKKATPKLKTPTPLPKPIKFPTPPPEDPKPKEPIGETGVKKDWWRIARAWVNMGKFYFVADKYGKFSHTRNELINKNKQAVGGHQDSLINWFNQFQVSFYEEFREIPDMNLAFTNYSGKLKIEEQSQKIIAILNIFLKNLVSYASKLNDIPTKIQEVIYNYVKEKAYYSPRLLSTYEINRLDFNFYGGIKNHTDASIGMIVALFLFSKTFVHRVMLRIKDFIPDFKNYRYIDTSMKYVGSVLHYLVRDSFRGNPGLTKDILALMNYYRNYHIPNEAVERSIDITNNNVQYKDIDEFSAGLVPEEQITSFFQNKVSFCETFKKYIFQWAVGIGRAIRLKYARTDQNLKE